MGRDGEETIRARLFNCKASFFEQKDCISARLAVRPLWFWGVAGTGAGRSGLASSMGQLICFKKKLAFLLG